MSGGRELQLAGGCHFGFRWQSRDSLEHIRTEHSTKLGEPGFEAISDKKKLRDISCMSGGGNFNLQGGAIYVTTGVQITIRDTTFERNTAAKWVSEISSAF